MKAIFTQQPHSQPDSSQNLLASPTLDQVFTLDSGCQLPMAPVNDDCINVERTRVCIAEKNNRRVTSEQSTEQPWQSYKVRDDYSVAAISQIPMVQDGLSTFWKQRLHSRGHNAPKSQGQARRVRRPNGAVGRPGELRIQEGEMMIFDIDQSVRAVTTKHVMQPYTPVQSRQGYRSLHTNRRLTDFRNDKHSKVTVTTLPAATRHPFRVSKERMGKSSSPKRRNRNNHEDRNQARMIDRKVLSTQTTPRLFTGIAKLKGRGSVVSGQQQQQQVQVARSQGRRNKVKKAAAQRQNAMSPLLIANMQLKEKFPAPDSEDDFIKEVEYLKSSVHNSALRFSRNKKSIQVTADQVYQSAGTMPIETNESTTMRQFRSRPTGGPNTNSSIEHTDQSSVHNSNKAHTARIVPPLNIVLARQKQLHNSSTGYPADLVNTTQSSLEKRSAMEEDNEISVATGSSIVRANNSKVEVINSASCAFRQFVKEKSAIRKMQESLILQRQAKAPIKNIKNLQLKAVVKNMNQCRVSVHSPDLQHILKNGVKTPGADTPCGTNIILRGSTIEGYQNATGEVNLSQNSIHLSTQGSKEYAPQQLAMQMIPRATPELRQLSVQEPVLGQTKPTQINNHESLKSGPFRQSTATLTGGDLRLGLGSSRRQTRGILLSRGCMGSRQQPPRSKVSTRADALAVAEAEQKYVLDRATSTVNPASFLNEEIPDGDSIQKNSSQKKNGSPTTGRSYQRNGHNLSDKAIGPSVSPTFKQLSEIFAFIDYRDHDQPDRQEDAGVIFEQVPIVQVQLTGRSNRRRQEQVRTSTRGGGSCAERGGRQIGSHDQKQRNTHTIEPRQVNKSQVSGNVNTTNNLQNRFFSLRRQRARLQENFNTVVPREKDLMMQMVLSGETPQRVSPRHYNTSIKQNTINIQRGNSPDTYGATMTFDDIQHLQAYMKQDSEQTRLAVQPGIQSRCGETQLEMAVNETEISPARIISPRRNNTATFDGAGNTGVQIRRSQKGLTISIDKLEKVKDNKITQSTSAFNAKEQDGARSQGVQVQIGAESVRREMGASASQDERGTLDKGHNVYATKPEISSPDTSLLKLMRSRESVNNTPGSLLKSPELSPAKAAKSIGQSMEVEKAFLSKPIQVDESFFNMMQFDPQVTITGINNDVLMDMRNSSAIESTLCKSYLLEHSAQQLTDKSIDKDIICGNMGLVRMEESFMNEQLVTLTPDSSLRNSPSKLRSVTPMTPMRSTNNQTPKNVWSMIKRQGENAIQPPLIVQQDAERHNREYVRVTKDGRFSVVGVDKSTRHMSPITTHSPERKTNSELEIAGSQPWKTQKESKYAKDLELQQLMSQERLRQDRSKFVVHHEGQSPDGTKTLVSVRKDANRPDSAEQPQTPTSMLHQKFKPTRRPTLLKPVIEASQFRRNNFDNGNTQPSGPERSLVKDEPDVQTHAKVPLPIIGFKEFKPPIMPMTERLAHENQQAQCIKQGSWRLKPLNKDGSEIPDDRSMLISSPEIGRVMSDHSGDVSRQRHHAPMPMRAIVRHMPSKNQSPEPQNQTAGPGGVFTFSKLIFRDRVGTGNNTMVKELKYVPAVDKQTRKKIISRRSPAQIEYPTPLQQKMGSDGRQYLHMPLVQSNNLEVPASAMMNAVSMMPASPAYANQMAVQEDLTFREYQSQDKAPTNIMVGKVPSPNQIAGNGRGAQQVMSPIWDNTVQKAR